MVWTPLVETLDDSLILEIINSESQISIEKFFGKARFVANLLSSHTYDSIDVNNPTLLVLLVPLVSVIFIRIENEKIKFYHIHRFVAICFIVILLSSSTIIPYNISAQYWGYAYSQETSSIEEIGPPVKLPPDDSIINETDVTDVPEQIIIPPGSISIKYNETVSNTNYILTESLINETNEKLFVNKTIVQTFINETNSNQTLNDTSIVLGNNYSISMPEQLIIADDSTIKQEQVVDEPLYNETKDITINLQEELVLADFSEPILYTHDKTMQLAENLTIRDDVVNKINGTITIHYVEQLIVSDSISILINNQTVLDKTSEQQTNALPSKLISSNVISDSIISLFNNGSIPDITPNATESWQFEMTPMK